MTGTEEFIHELKKVLGGPFRLKSLSYKVRDSSNASGEISIFPRWGRRAALCTIWGAPLNDYDQSNLLPSVKIVHAEFLEKLGVGIQPQFNGDLTLQFGRRWFRISTERKYDSEGKYTLPLKVERQR